MYKLKPSICFANISKILPPKKNPPIFFRLRRAVTKMCIWPFAFPKKTPIFFACGGLSQRCVYGFLSPPPNNLQFFFACGGLLQRSVYGQKSPQFFSPAAGCHKDVYGHLPPPKNLQWRGDGYNSPSNIPL